MIALLMCTFWLPMEGISAKLVASFQIVTMGNNDDRRLARKKARADATAERNRQKELKRLLKLSGERCSAAQSQDATSHPGASAISAGSQLETTQPATSIQQPPQEQVQSPAQTATQQPETSHTTTALVQMPGGPPPPPPPPPTSQQGWPVATPPTATAVNYRESISRSSGRAYRVTEHVQWW